MVINKVPLCCTKYVSSTLATLPWAAAFAFFVEAAVPERAMAQAFSLDNARPLAEGPAKENSGIVRSRLWPETFWMHNDSGDEPRIYAIRRDGTLFQAERDDDKTPGTLVGGAINVDWEDIAIDNRGHLIVADVGNNGNNRRDLALYYLAEPAPSAERTAFLRKVFVRYPDQKAFPAPDTDFNYDAEGVFAIEHRIYILTKHRSDSATKLYCYDPDATPAGDVATLEYVDRFEIGGQATAADATPDGKRVVVATYDAFWLFEVEDPRQPLRGPVSKLEYTGAKQVEALCFADDRTLLAADEATGKLFEAPLDRFHRVNVARSVPRRDHSQDVRQDSSQDVRRDK